MARYIDFDHAFPPEILVVDDNLDSLNLIHATLSGQGYKVRCASSGKLALASVAEKKPDVILLDIVMPDMDGYETCKLLKSNHYCKHIPIIFISGLNLTVDKVKAFSSGGTDFITKPFQPDELLIRVENQLVLQKMQIALERSKEELEERVKHRTKALAKANKKLRSEIAERKQVQEVLKDSEERYRLLFDYADVLVSVYNRKGTCILMNRKVAALFGGRPENFIGKTLSELHPDAANTYTQRIRQAIDSGKPKDYEDEVVFPHGKRVLLSRVHPIPDAKGRIQSAQIISQDITDRIRIEKENQSLARQIHQNRKMEAMGTLANGVAHDFNNILFALSGYTELSFEFADDNSKLEGHLQKMKKAIRRASDLVRQILTFSRNVETKLQPIQPKLIIKEALNLLRASFPATIEFKINIVSEAYILADASQVHQILMNLCVNSAHAMEPDGGILTVAMNNLQIEESTVHTSTQLSPGSYLVLTIEDTGKGIPKSILNRIFDPYFTTKPQDKGTGLGLATVYGIIESYGGSIDVSSEPNKGSRFDVFLPVYEVNQPTPESFDMDLQNGSEAIIVVDNEETLVDVCGKMLENLGYSVTAMTSSVDALQTIKEEPGAYSLLITDYMMRHMTGMELAHSVKKIVPEMPILMLSGNHDPIHIGQARKIGIDELLEKPLTQKDLSEYVRRLIDQRQFNTDTTDGD